METAIVMDQDIDESEEEENLSGDDLPVGIFPEADPESCYHALKKNGLACTRLNAELFYEMDQLRRNRMRGCSTEELGEIDLWDPCSGQSIWEEPMARNNGRLLNPEESQDNQDREARWQHVERSLQQVYQWCLRGEAPEVVRHRNQRGRLTWRFRKLKWTEAGIGPADSASQEATAIPSEVLQTAWNYLFWCRRRWLVAHRGKVWLSEPCLHLIRYAFKALLDHFEVTQADRPDIKEEDKPTWPSRLEAELAGYEGRERKALERLDYLQRHEQLTKEKLSIAVAYLDEAAEKIAATQRRLEEEIVRLARKCGYDDNYYGTRLELACLSPDDLLELKEEMRQVMAADIEPASDSSCINGTPEVHVYFTPAPLPISSVHSTAA
jgi:hypothetical protein